MNENFIICIKAVAPMFLTMLVGYVTRLSGIVDDASINKFNRMIFHTLFPIMLFWNIYSENLGKIFNVKLIIYIIICIFVVYFGSTLLTGKIESNKKSRGALIQAIYRSNFLMMGMPIAVNLYGNSNVGVTALMVAIVVPIYNVLAVVTLETYRGSAVNSRKIVMGIVRNPLILGIAVGVVFSVLNIPLGDVIEETVSELAAAASPVALLLLGASFKAENIEKCRRNLLIAVIMRLIVVPGFVMTIGALIGFRDIEFVTLMSVFGSPCAISSFTMALEMDSDADLAANTVIFTSSISCFTLFGWLMVFKSLGVF